MSPAATPAPAGQTLSRTLVNDWETQHLTDTGDWLREQGRHSRESFDQIHQNIRGTDWSGDAKDAAVDRVSGDVSVADRQATVMEEAATIAEDGARDVQSAKRDVLEAIREAEDDGFRVAEDLSVSDSRRVDLLEYRTRHMAMTAHAETVKWRAEQLVQTDALVGRRLAEKAVELDGIRFEGEGGEAHAASWKTGTGPGGFEISPFTQDGVEEGGSPGFDPEHNAQGIRGDEGVIINGDRILFGDTARLTPDGQLEYIGAPMYKYHLDEDGRPIIDGPPLTGGAVEQGVRDGHRIIPVGSTGPDGMPNGTNLLFGKEWAWGNENFPNDTVVYDTSGPGPFPNVKTIPGIRDMTVVPYGDNQLLVSGVTGTGADSVRQAWVTPSQSAPGNYDFLDRQTWTPVAGSLPANIQPDGESTAALFPIDAPNGTQYGLITTNPENSAVEIRVAQTPDGLMSAPATVLAEGNGHYLYSPNVTQVVPQADGGYRVDMTYSERFNPQPDPKLPGYVEPGNLCGQVYQNTFGHVTVVPPLTN